MASRLPSPSLRRCLQPLLPSAMQPASNIPPLHPPPSPLPSLLPSLLPQPHPAAISVYAQSRSLTSQSIQARSFPIRARGLACPRPPTSRAFSVGAKINPSRVSLSTVLRAKHSDHWVEYTISRSSSLHDAIDVMITRDLSGLMVVDLDASVNELTRQRGKVLGMISSRDLLRRIHQHSLDEWSLDAVHGELVESFMTPLASLVFARPEETVAKASEVMAHTDRVMLPVISSEGRVEGIVTAKDFLGFGVQAKEKGGKEAYLKDMAGRTGAEQTSMAEPPEYMANAIKEQQQPLFGNFGFAALPHPFKTPTGVAGNARLHGPGDYANDLDLSEDASFFYKDTPSSGVTFAGVADGVGSWRQFGVDPRLFARALMRHCKEVLAGAPGEKKDGTSAHMRPVDVLRMAHEKVIAEDVVGSCTATLMAFDNTSHQVTFSNIGDSGIIVLRHIDSNVAGSLKRDRVTRREERTSDLRVTFVSQQQLREFNHPYQLGWTGKELEKDDKTSLKTHTEACTSSIYVRRGDIIIMATDGLFDNVDIDEIQKICLEWEKDNHFIDEGGDIRARQKRWESGAALTEKSLVGVNVLAEELVRVARERSLETDRDSPFAILAKENDIMWSGGMPDDCTVTVCHVVGTQCETE